MKEDILLLIQASRVLLEAIKTGTEKELIEADRLAKIALNRIS